MTTALKAKRVAAGISGIVLCKKAGISRARLSDLERGYITVTQSEQARILAALNQLIAAQHQLQKLATRLGWPGMALPRTLRHQEADDP
jgi:transcriptional regulator with XRE-family HTH domain